MNIQPADLTADGLLTEEAFERLMRPVTRPGTDHGDGWPYELTLDQPLANVWTVVEGDDDGLYACKGYHVVNRVYYLVTEEPWTDETPDGVWFASDPLADCDHAVLSKCPHYS